MTGQGSSQFEAIQRAKQNKLNPINIGKAFKTVSGDRVRGLRDCWEKLNENDLQRTHVIKGEVLVTLETGMQWTKETWLIDGTHIAYATLNLVEYKPVTPRLPKLFSGL